MRQELFVGIFAEEEQILAASVAARQAGYRIHDAFTPYPVHGLDEAIGLKKSRLAWVCLVCSVTGILAAGLGQFWIGAIDWPLNVGGKPVNSVPAYLPVTFELMVLLGGLGGALMLFVRTRLYPGRKEWLPGHGVTNNRFALALVASDCPENRDSVRQLFSPFGLIELNIASETET
jgi:hypothetical protein